VPPLGVGYVAHWPGFIKSTLGADAAVAVLTPRATTAPMAARPATKLRKRDRTVRTTNTSRIVAQDAKGAARIDPRGLQRDHYGWPCGPAGSSVATSNMTLYGDDKKVQGISGAPRSPVRRRVRRRLQDQRLSLGPGPQGTWAANSIKMRPAPSWVLCLGLGAGRAMARSASGAGSPCNTAERSGDLGVGTLNPQSTAKGRGPVGKPRRGFGRIRRPPVQAPRPIGTPNSPVVRGGHR